MVEMQEECVELGKSSPEPDTEGEAIEMMGIPVLDDATEHEALEAYAEEAEKDEDLQQDGKEVKEILRTVTPTTSTPTHRQIEAMQIGELSLERRNFIAMKEMCEDSDDAKTKAIEELKTYVKKQDQKATVVKLDCSNWLNQAWHDQRYYRARKAGVPHSVAWRKEKGRRHATLFRQRGVAERAQQRRDLEEQWRADHMSGNASIPTTRRTTTA